MVAEKLAKRKCSFGISSLDLVGKKSSFEFPTFSRSLKTAAGSCLTLVIGLVAIAATAIIGSKYFDTSSPSITFSNEIGPEISHNMVKELILPPMTVYMEGSPLQTNISRMATLKAISMTFLFNPDTSLFKMIGYVETDFVYCKELNDPYFNQILEKIGDKNKFKNILKCPDFKGNYSLSDVLSDSKNVLYKYLMLNAYPCSLDDRSQCISSDEVSKLRLVVANPKKSIDPSNYTHPYKITVTTEEIALNPSRTKQRKFVMQRTKITDLRNDILGPEKKDEFSSTPKFFRDSASRIGMPLYCEKGKFCTMYMNFQFEGGSEVIQVKRKYTLPTEIIGEIGGVLKVALMFGMAYTFYNQAKKKAFVIESVFSGQKKKTSRVNQVGPLRGISAKNGTGVKQGSGQEGRIKLIGRNQSLNRLDKNHQKAVDKECFESATCFSDLIENINYLDLIERLALNDLTKKMLPQAVLIRRLILETPSLQKRYHALKKGSKRHLSQETRMNTSSEEFVENRLERSSRSETISNEKGEKGSSSETKREPEIDENQDKLNHLLKNFIESQINYPKQKGVRRFKIEAKYPQYLEVVKEEEEIVVEIRNTLNFDNNEIQTLCKAPEIVGKKSPQEGQKQRVGSQQDSEGCNSSSKKNINLPNRPGSLARKSSQALRGQRSRSMASLRSRRLFKSRFSPSGLRKKNRTKLE